MFVSKIYALPNEILIFFVENKLRERKCRHPNFAKCCKAKHLNSCSVHRTSKAVLIKWTLHHCMEK